MTSARRRPFIVRAYFRSYRLLDRALTLLAAGFTGCWLAALTDQRRFLIDQEYYDRQSMYHAASHNEGGYFDWERAAIDASFRGCRSLLVSSAGGGREVISLSRDGFEVTAFECHPELVHVANELIRRHQISTDVQVAARDECPDFGKRFDGMVVGWGSYTLIRGRARRVRFLRQARAQLVPDAPLLVSFFARSSGRRQLRVAARIGNALGRLLGGDRVELGDYLAPNFVHFFTRDEIASELKEAGFVLAEFRREPYGYAVAHVTQEPSCTLSTA